jgi:NAD(P)H-dependent flavin oxidoreductase YrpB (nitropropane dioxygenase family)
MVLVPQAAVAVRIPVIAAGGIYDGRGMAAALALGAEGVQVGTRLAATVESSAHENFKRAMVEASPTGTFLVLKKLVPARVIVNEWTRRVRRPGDPPRRGRHPLDRPRLRGDPRTPFNPDLKNWGWEIDLNLSQNNKKVAKIIFSTFFLVQKYLTFFSQRAGAASFASHSTASRYRFIP